MFSHTRSATLRLAIFYSLAFTIVTLLLGVTIYRAMRVELARELDHRITAERTALLREGTGGLDRLSAAVTARQQHGGADMIYAIVSPSGVARVGPSIRAPLIPGWSDAFFQEADGGFDGARIVTSALPDGSLLVVGADPESIEDLDERMVPLFATAFGIMALIGGLGAFAMRATLKNRLDAITGTAEAIIGGDLTRRMEVHPTGDEFNRLSTTLNLMLDRIDALMNNLRQVSGDIAHDLRTPLSRLRQTLEQASAGPTDVTLLRAANEDATTQADEILALFAAILEISEVEAGGPALRLRRFDLSALVSDIAESYIPAAEDSGRTMTAAIAEGIEIEGQRELVAQLLVNILDNAIRHTPPGAAITITLAEPATLTIADNGPGIPPTDRARVFERFTRLESSRTTPGHGLGLRLVSAIAVAHGAKVALEDNHPGVKLMISFDRPAR